MSLSPGARFGSYEVIAPAGAAGSPAQDASARQLERFLRTASFVDTMPDGRLAIDGPSMAATPELRLVFNWFNELRDKVE